LDIAIGSNGFLIIPNAPNSLYSISSAPSATADIKIAGILSNLGFLRIFLSIAGQSISGIITSSKNKSGLNSSAAINASFPELQLFN